MQIKRKNSLSISERLACGGNLSIDEYADWRNQGRVTVFKEIASGKLKSIKVGKRRLIPASCALARQQELLADTEAGEVA